MKIYLNMCILGTIVHYVLLTVYQDIAHSLCRINIVFVISILSGHSV